MADKQISQLVAATTINDEDLFVMQQGGTAKKLSGQKLADFVYQSAADQIERVDEAVEQAEAAVEYLEEQKNEIAQAVASMAGLGTDTTLSTPGMAADAAATGEVKAMALAHLEQGSGSGSIVTFNDGADGASLKKLLVDIDPVQDLHGYSNPWPAGGGKNLFPQQNVSGTGTAIIECSAPAGEHTISFTVTSSDTDASTSIILISFADGTSTTKAYNRGSVAAAWFNFPAAVTQITFYASDTYDHSVGDTFTFSNVQLEAGRVRTNYAPYSNICPISGHTEANIIRAGKNLISSDVYVISSTTVRIGTIINDADIMLKQGTYSLYVTYPSDVSVYFGHYGEAFGSYARLGNTNARLNFTITKPTEIVGFYLYSSGGVDPNSISGSYLQIGDVTPEQVPASIAEYNVSFPVGAGVVYGGTIDTVNRQLIVKYKNVDLGTLNWNKITGGNNAAFSAILSDWKGVATSTAPKNVISDTYPFGAKHNGQSNLIAALPDNSWGYVYGTSKNFYIRDDDYSSAEDFKDAMLGSYIVYELAEYISYNLTQTEVKTILAINNIWADTGNIAELVYYKMPISAEEIYNTVESMIAGVEETMEASQNYTAGKLVVAEHKLYHISSNIAAGETLTPGTNCYISTVADELASLEERVSLQFSALGNLSDLSYQVVT